jgi:hypothetical protein
MLGSCRANRAVRFFPAIAVKVNAIPELCCGLKLFSDKTLGGKHA